MSSILRNINALPKADKSRLKELTTSLIIGIYNKNALPKDRYVPSTVLFKDFVQELVSQIEAYQVLPDNIINALKTQESEASGENGFILQNNFQTAINSLQSDLNDLDEALESLLGIINEIDSEPVLKTNDLLEIENYTGIHPIIIFYNNDPVENIIYVHNPDSEDGDIPAIGLETGSWFRFESGGEAVLEEDVFVNTLNNIQIGETLAEGLTFTDYIKKKYNQVFNPDLSEIPTFSLSISPTAIQEVGTNYTGTLTFNFNRGAIRGTVNPDGTWNASGFQNPRAGEATSYLLDGDLSPTNTASVNRTIVQGSNVFNGTVTYGEGSQPLDSNGNPFDSPLAAATSPNRTATITGRYRQFFGGSSSVPESSSDVRNLPLNNFDNVNTFTINTGTSNTIFSIAIPASKNLISVIDTGNLNANITSQYNLISSSFIVKDAGDNDVNYKLYVLQLGSPYPESTNHVITVS